MASIEELQKSIKVLEHKERYSKNQMEKRSLRQSIGKLQRELYILKHLNIKEKIDNEIKEENPFNE